MVNNASAYFLPSAHCFIVVAMLCNLNLSVRNILGNQVVMAETGCILARFPPQAIPTTA